MLWFRQRCSRGFSMWRSRVLSRGALLLLERYLVVFIWEQCHCVAACLLASAFIAASGPPSGSATDKVLRAGSPLEAASVGKNRAVE